MWKIFCYSQFSAPLEISAEINERLVYSAHRSAGEGGGHLSYAGWNWSTPGSCPAAEAETPTLAGKGAKSALGDVFVKIFSPSAM